LIRRDAISGALLLLLAAGYWRLSSAIPESSLSDEVGADGLPRVLAAALAVVALLLIGKALLGRQPAPAAAAPEGEHAGLPRALGFVAIGIGYMLVAPLVGFAVGVAALIVAVALYEGERPSPKLLAVAAAGGVGFWAVFVRLLGTEQPAALLLQKLAGA
jgi:putative tricarboxylic transport membrane protein